MPWKEEHKQSTRQRIVAAAASAIRLHGPDGVSVGQIMKSAGLTHGGFYAHFGSKDELVAEALRHAGDETRAFLEEKAAQGQKEPPGLAALAKAYLCGQHRDHPEHGCPLAACAPELARGDPRVQAALGDVVNDYLAWLKQHADGPGRQSDSQVLGTLAAMIGGMILARAAGDAKQSDKVLKAVQRFLEHDD
jgi:TetR/AcrR family transcriptional repressor of nem operon